MMTRCWLNPKHETFCFLRLACLALALGRVGSQSVTDLHAHQQQDDGINERTRKETERLLLVGRVAFFACAACLVACCVIVDFISLRAATHSHKHPERLSDSIRARNWTNIDSTNWFLIGKTILLQLNLIQSQISRLLSKY